MYLVRQSPSPRPPAQVIFLPCAQRLVLRPMGLALLLLRAGREDFRDSILRFRYKHIDKKPFFKALLCKATSGSALAELSAKLTEGLKNSCQHTSPSKEIDMF